MRSRVTKKRFSGPIRASLAPLKSKREPNEAINYYSVDTYKEVDFLKFVQVPSFIPFQFKRDEIITAHCRFVTCPKVYITNNDSAYTEVKCSFTDNLFFDKNIIFILSHKNGNLNAEDEIVYFSTIQRKKTGIYKYKHIDTIILCQY